WPDWPGPALVLHGPEGCGKTHLAHVFAARTGAVIIRATDLGLSDPPVLLENAAVVVEDADTGVDERALFHLYNAAKEAGRKLLITAQTAPSRWGLRLPDLRSRLSAAQQTAILPPDDTLMTALLVKLFTDRQLRVGPEVISYLMGRMERSFHAARQVVAAADALALAERRQVTVPLLRKVLGDV
ncbi:MAG: DNA replication protein, partial [Rhodospirillales bacterium]|nr:DNA replication protein [Rhodospirillales bacterium]